MAFGPLGRDDAAFRLIRLRPFLVGGLAITVAVGMIEVTAERDDRACRKRFVSLWGAFAK
jgi:hypothetical protein